jgi:large subunit ribosomal protein L24
MKIHKGDKVKVISGKDKGKVGKVLSVFPNSRKVIVEGVNMVKKHHKGTPDNSGGIIDKETSIHISSLALFTKEGSQNKGSKVGFKYLEDGRKVRYFRCNGELIDA